MKARADQIGDPPTIEDAATLPTLKFNPSVHVNYLESVLLIDDGFPKFRDFPVEFGGRRISVGIVSLSGKDMGCTSWLPLKRRCFIVVSCIHLS